MDKIEMRKLCRKKLRTFDAESFDFWGREMTKILVETPEWKRAKTVFVYISLPNEPDTSELIFAALAQGKRLCVPKITGEGVMKAVELKNVSRLKKGKFGISEPDEADDEIFAEQIDLIVLPCLAADKSGARLGKGGGYYDRFCENFDGNKFVFCAEELLFEAGAIFMEKWDVYADVITQKEIVHNSRS